MEYKSILGLINMYFKNFTLIDVVGYYKGTSESSKILRIIDIDNRVINIENIIDTMKVIANQECILLTITEINAKLI